MIACSSRLSKPVTMHQIQGLLLVLSALIALFYGQLSAACHIAGSDNGVCMDPVDFADDMPFCRSVVRYPACVPLQNTGIESQSVAGKDKWVRDKVTSVISERISLENNDRLKDQGVNEHGHNVEIKERFDGNSDCQNSYKNYMCYLNFPRCDQEGRSLIMCRTTCKNYFKSCKYDDDMKRCGDPKYFGADGPEEEIQLDENGNPTFWRAQYPGQPFRDMERDGDGNPLGVCTPSIEGGASPTLSTSIVFGISLLFLACYFIHLLGAN